MNEKTFVIATSRPWYNELAEQLHASTGFKFHLINSKEDLQVDALKQMNPRYVFFPHWSYMIAPEIYENFECVIFHMTDLPYGRGGSPLQNLIVRKEYQTMISALKCVGEVDAGPIYFKEPLSLAEGSAADIFDRCIPIIKSMIQRLVKENPVPTPQSGEVVMFKRRTPTESEIRKINSLAEIHDFIRMLDAPDYPKAYLDIGEFRFEFCGSQINDNNVEAKVKIRKLNEKK